MESFPILFAKSWRARGLDKAISTININALRKEYLALREAAPRRSHTGKKYFPGHTGVTSSSGASNRLEEHWTVALVNLDHKWSSPETGTFRLLDYQVPLKGRQSDKGIGKLDLLGFSENGQILIIECKIKGNRQSRGDAPPGALMEGLRYAAMVEADLEAIAREVENCFDVKVARTKPVVQLIADDAWWDAWLELGAAGNWAPAFNDLINMVHAQIGITVECLALENVNVHYGVDGKPPIVERIPRLLPVRLGSPNRGDQKV